ncbi:hypothetical protein [Streptomyces sp. NPDC002540]
MLFTATCLHGLRAKLRDDPGSLDRFPPELATMARKVAGTLDMPESRRSWKELPKDELGEPGTETREP